jgi:hypothetical protein
VETAPLLSRKLPEDWQRWRKHSEKPGLEKELVFIDRCAAGKLLEGSELVAAVRNRLEKGFMGPFETVSESSGLMTNCRS